MATNNSKPPLVRAPLAPKPLSNKPPVTRAGNAPLTEVKIVTPDKVKIRSPGSVPPATK